MDDWRRLNVAITRAKYSMWIVGHASTLKQSSEWRELISDAKKRDAYIDHSGQTDIGNSGVASAGASSSSHHGRGKVGSRSVAQRLASNADHRPWANGGYYAAQAASINPRQQPPGMLPSGYFRNDNPRYSQPPIQNQLPPYPAPAHGSYHSGIHPGSLRTPSPHDPNYGNDGRVPHSMPNMWGAPSLEASLQDLPIAPPRAGNPGPVISYGRHDGSHMGSWRT